MVKIFNFFIRNLGIFLLRVSNIKGIGGGVNTLFWFLILFYIAFTKLQDAFYRLKKFKIVFEI